MGEKVGRGGGAVMADEMGEGMQCSDHPYRSNPGGICAFCLQEKLGKLVASSKFSDPFFSIPPPPSSSSSPPSFPSSDLPALPTSTRISFLSAKHRRRKMKTHSAAAAAAAAEPNAESLVLNRSKSVAPRRGGEVADASDSPRKKSFWSFLTLSYSSSTSSAPIPTSFITKRRSTSSASSSSAVAGTCVSDLPKAAKEDEASAGNDDASPSGSQASSSFGRKVARSRSVGCGSRSFSGDFLERISNGFGDCTLRRVESHREAKQKASIHRGDRPENDEEQRIKERIKCGGIFVGLGMTTYWLSATSAADACGDSVRLPAARRGSAPHGRSKSWGWAFASPMRAFRPGGGGGQTTIIAAGGDVTGGGRIHRC